MKPAPGRRRGTSPGQGVNLLKPGNLFIAIWFLSAAGCARPPVPPSGEVNELIAAGDARFEIDNFAGAENAYRQALTISPADPHLLLRLGFCRWEAMDREEAETIFFQAMRLGAGDTEVLARAAGYWMSQGEWARALEQWRAAAELEPGAPAFLLGEVECLVELDQPAVALEACERIPRELPDEARYEVLILKTRALLKLGRGGQAREVVRAAIALRPEGVEAYRVLSLCPLTVPPTDFAVQTTLSAPPDVVLVSIDTLRADRLGCYGNPRPVSPGLDGFARESVLFRRVLSQSPHTSPSHMSVLTGMMPNVH